VDDEAEVRRKLRSCLQGYKEALAGGGDEAAVDAWIDRAEELVPQANLSDLYFWGERQRTDEEVIDEAVRRQKIWSSGGELALLIHLEAQLSSAAADPALEYVYAHYAKTELVRVREKIAAFAGSSTH
jgi:hypothetical protein